MTGVLEKTPPAQIVMLPPLFLSVTDYTLSAARRYQAQNDLSGGLHLLSSGMNRHQLVLRGHIAADSRAQTAAALSQMLLHQTALSFSVDGITCSGFAVAEYTLTQARHGCTCGFTVTLIGDSVTAEEET